MGEGDVSGETLLGPPLFDGLSAGPRDPKLRAGRAGRKRRALPTGPVI